MRKLGVVIALAVTAACIAVAAASGERTRAPTAVAGALPRGYRLLMTETFHRGGGVRVAYYGRHASGDPYDSPLVVRSIRGHRKLDPGDRPVLYRGDRRTTVRGHRAVLRTLLTEEEEKVYGHELIWRERPDLVIAVQLARRAQLRRLRAVAEDVRLLDGRAWRWLYRQSSYDAQTGRVGAGMPRLRVRRGRVRGHRWSLYAVIPRHYPLSRDDLRVACTEIHYRGRRGHGDDCGALPNWQRIGGTIFVFGQMGPRVKRVRIRSWNGGSVDRRAATARATRGPHMRYFAAPLRDDACAVRITRAGHPHEEGVIVMPLHGRDARRCGLNDSPPPP